MNPSCAGNEAVGYKRTDDVKWGRSRRRNGFRK